MRFHQNMMAIRRIYGMDNRNLTDDQQRAVLGAALVEAIGGPETAEILAAHYGRERATIDELAREHGLGTATVERMIRQTKTTLRRIEARSGVAIMPVEWERSSASKNVAGSLPAGGRSCGSHRGSR